MHTAYLSLGTNLGFRKRNLKKAQKLLEECGVHIKKASKIYETKAVSRIQQPKFLNQALKVQTRHSPQKLLNICQSVESQMGRKKPKPKRINYELPRIIDIDILLYDNLKINTPRLKIPHPRMHLRDFVLKPLNDIAQGVKYI